MAILYTDDDLLVCIKQFGQWSMTHNVTHTDPTSYTMQWQWPIFYNENALSVGIQTNN